MAMKVYVIGGYRFQFEEGNQPEGAVEFAGITPAAPKAPKQSRAPKNKQVEPESDK